MVCSRVNILLFLHVVQAHTGSRGRALFIPTFGIRGECSATLPWRDTPGENPDTSCTGNCGFQGRGLKISVLCPPGFEPRFVQSVASRCTDYVFSCTISNECYRHNAWRSRSLNMGILRCLESWGTRYPVTPHHIPEKRYSAPSQKHLQRWAGTHSSIGMWPCRWRYKINRLATCSRPLGWTMLEPSVCSVFVCTDCAFR